MTKRCLAIMLAIVMIVCIFTACKSKPNVSNTQIITEAPTQIAEDTTSFKLSYTQSDSLNPFKSTTLNNQILQNLIYESLFVIDESYEAQPSIASGYTYRDNKTLVVTIESGHIFSDGTQITVDDILYSFREAQVSPHWKNALSPISNAYIENSNTIVFELYSPNANAQNLLTFAISKSDKSKDGYFIGSGRYMLKDEAGGVCLAINPLHKDFNPHFTKITLVNVASSESIDNAVNIGNITYAFRDLAEGDNTRMTCNKKLVGLNNLVYIGINSATGIMANENIRQALSLVIDRETLVKSAYQGYAKPATSVFNPASKQGKQTALFSKKADIPAAKQAIAQSGYGESDLKIDILVNGNRNRSAMATLIKQQLESVGFKVTITKLANAQYKEYVKNGYFDIYIGETKIPNDMRLNSFFDKKGATSYGISVSKNKTTKSYNAYMNGDGDLGTFLLDFSNEMPFVPVLYRQGMICYSKSMHGDMQAYNGNYFSNIQDWYCS